MANELFKRSLKLSSQVTLNRYLLLIARKPCLKHTELGDSDEVEKEVVDELARAGSQFINLLIQLIRLFNPQ